MANKINWDDILVEWSYRLPKGYPTMKDGKFTNKKELAILDEILAENGINEAPNNTTQPTTSPRVNKEALIDLINKMPLDAMSDSGIQKLYNRIKAYTVFKPLRAALFSKGYSVDKKKGFDIPKQVSNVLQGFLEDLPPDSYNSFVNYIQDPEQQVPFPTKQGWGNFRDIIPEVLDSAVLKSIAQYTGQDERKRGVGMGEVLMALVFSNISKPSKGDLRMNDGEFEVKGAGAILGGLSTVPAGSVDKILEPTGITNANSKPVFTNSQGQTSEKPFDKAKLSLALAASVADGKGLAVKEAVKNLMLQSGLEAADVDEAIKLIEDWNSATAADINRVFGLGNFIRYATKETFTRFVAVDYGSGGKGEGKYVYVEGDPITMAQKLMKYKIGFEGVSVSILWPRIDATGGPTDVLKESLEEDSDY
jgi:hypothetical protein